MIVLDTSWCDAYYYDAAYFYNHHFTPEYEYCENDLHRYFMVRDYAKWLYQLDQVIRIWE